jgi:hypothetical protein
MRKLYRLSAVISDSKPILLRVVYICHSVNKKVYGCMSNTQHCSLRSHITKPLIAGDNSFLQQIHHLKFTVIYTNKLRHSPTSSFYR